MKLYKYKVVNIMLFVYICRSDNQFKYYPHSNDAAVWVSVLYLHVAQMKNSSQNLEESHLIGLINTCGGKTHRQTTGY